LKALIVDDEIDICHLLIRILKRKHVEATYVNTILDAQNHLILNEPDIIFLDNHLSDGLGIDFVTIIKNHTPAAKIIMITAHDTVADKEAAIARGVDIFIGKPFNEERIYNELTIIEQIKRFPLL